jgi:hypothetical protein
VRGAHDRTKLEMVGNEHGVLESVRSCIQKLLGT